MGGTRAVAGASQKFGLTLGEKLGAILAAIGLAAAAVTWSVVDGARRGDDAIAAIEAAERTGSVAKTLEEEAADLVGATLRMLAARSPEAMAALTEQTDEAAAAFDAARAQAGVDGATIAAATAAFDALTATTETAARLQSRLGLAQSYAVEIVAGGGVAEVDALTIEIDDKGHALETRADEEAEFDDGPAVAAVRLAVAAWRRVAARALGEPITERWDAARQAQEALAAALADEALDPDFVTSLTALADAFAARLTAFAEGAAALDAAAAAVDRDAAALADAVRRIRAEVDAREARAIADLAATLKANETRVIVIIGVAGATAMTLGVLLVLSVTRPMRQLVDAMRRAAEGDLNAEPPRAAPRTEIGGLAVAMCGFQRAARERRETRLAREAEEQAEKLRLAEEARNAEAFVGSLAAAIERCRAGDLTVAVAPIDGLAFSAPVAEAVNRLIGALNAEFAALRDLAESLAAGRLDGRLDAEKPGVFGETAADLNRAVSHFDDLVGAIGDSAARVGEAGRAINASARALQGRTESTASALEGATATSEEMAASLADTAEKAREAAARADAARDGADAGAAVVADAVDAIGRIEASSSRIAEIVGVIDAIAFQTNLLALNAAVEAARAGDAGRGFAVVATEVRTLAQRAASSAGDIRGLITKSAVDVSDGVEKVRAAGVALDGISLAVRELDGLIAPISAAARELAESGADISNTVVELDQLNAENAFASADAAEASRALAASADHLEALLARFKTDAAAQETPMADQAAAA